MKKTVFTVLTVLSIALLCFSCSNETDNNGQGYKDSGQIEFICSTERDITNSTKASGTYQIPSELIPNIDSVILSIVGNYTDSETGLEETYTYEPVFTIDYHDALPYIPSGNEYTASFKYGTLGAEGETAAYFGADVEFEVVARGTRSKNVSLVLQNSIIRIQTDSLFDNYYSNAKFTVTTTAGNSFNFSIPQEKETIYFVDAASTLTLRGTATKKYGGKQVNFNPHEIGITKAQTMSTINITVGSVGGGNINITLNNTLTQMTPIEIELNPES